MSGTVADKPGKIPEHFSLGSDFPPVTKEQWVQLVEETLKGADFEKRLVSKTYDGIRIEPIYQRRADVAPLAKEAEGRWVLSQRMDHPDTKEANKQALTDLENGANGLVVTCKGARSARGFGSFSKETDLDTLFKGIVLDSIHLRFDRGCPCIASVELFQNSAKAQGFKPEDLSIDYAIDPVGILSGKGFLKNNIQDVLAKLVGKFGNQISEKGNIRFLLADGRYAHEAGASEAQELAIVLATAVTYLKGLIESGIPAEKARSAISFLLVANAEQFTTIAKFRALRHLWARIEKAFNLTPKPIRLHAETSWWMMTRIDPWVNMLRTTIATFSAAIGGADSITVLPFTNTLGLPDAFARRVARNTQIVLSEESNLWRVADPAAGAGSYEELTDALAQKAWSLFQAIEKEGGIVASLQAGTQQKIIADVLSARQKAISKRKDPLLGASEFPNLFEEPVSVLLPFPTEAQGCKAESPALTASALPCARAAEPFETMRDISNNYLAEHKKRPAIFLANLGSIATFTGRATFAKNFFEAGGVEALMNDGFKTGVDAANAFAKSGAKIACICSSDDYYAEEGVNAAEALKAAGCTHIFFAGKGGDLTSALQTAGVGSFIYLGCDALDIMNEALRCATAQV